MKILVSAICIAIYGLANRCYVIRGLDWNATAARKGKTFCDLSKVSPSKVWTAYIP